MRRLILAAVVALAACGTSKPPQEVRLKFDPEVHRAYFPAGHSEIRGQALLRQPGDSDVTCAGHTVIATPDSAFFRQLLELAARGQMPLIGDAVGAENVAIVRQSTCDSAGNFAIGGLPPGDWLVAAPVNWTVRNVTHGGLLAYKVRLRDKELVQVVMTDRDIGVPAPLGPPR